MNKLSVFNIHESELCAKLSSNSAKQRNLDIKLDKTNDSISKIFGKNVFHNVGIEIVFIQIKLLIPFIESELFSPNIILIDVRENRFYQTRHLKGAINSSCHTKIMTKRSKHWWSSIYETTNDVESIKKIFLYDNKSSEDQSSTTSSNMLSFAQFLLNLGHEVFIIDGGWQSIQLQFGCLESLFESSIEKELYERYSTSPTSNASPCIDVLNATASKIEDFLYLGNERDSQDLDLLVSLGITHILNVTNDVKNAFDGELALAEHCMQSAESKRFTYCRLAASDSHSQDLYKFFNTAFEFIENVRLQPNSRVLVHCWAGVSRSATIIIAYLMRFHQLDVQHALDRVFAKRPIIAPNLNFMGQLERYYRSEICCTSTHTPLCSRNGQLLCDNNSSPFSEEFHADHRNGDSDMSASSATSPTRMLFQESGVDVDIHVVVPAIVEEKKNSLIVSGVKFKRPSKLAPLKLNISIDKDDSSCGFAFPGKCRESFKSSTSNEQHEWATVQLFG